LGPSPRRSHLDAGGYFRVAIAWETYFANRTGDIAGWCPAYPEAGVEQRAAFWAVFMSALA